MANVDSPRGFLACDNQFGGEYTGRMRKVAFLAADAAATFIGSMVEFTGASLDSAGKIPIVTLAAPGVTTGLAGAIQNFDPERDGNWTNYGREANQLKAAYIPMDAKCFYQVQEDGDAGNIDVDTQLFNNIDLTAEVGVVTGQSTQELDSSTAASTATLPLRLENVVEREDNDGTSASTNATWIVSLNGPQELATTGATP